MGFVKCCATTKKVELPGGTVEFSHCIGNLVEKHHIQPELIINFDQTPSKYVCANESVMARRDSTSVPIAASEDKKITANFAINLMEPYYQYS